MIQRIQSFYLFVAAALGALLFFFPMITYTKDPQVYKLFATGLKFIGALPVTVSFWSTFPLLVIILASVVLSLATIFLYKKRRQQVLLVSINVLLNVLLIALVFLVYSRWFENRLQIPSSYQFGIYIPLIALVFLILASRAIRKDEALVKSTDRLR